MKPRILVVGKPPLENLPELEATMQRYREKFRVIIEDTVTEAALVTHIGDVQGAVIPWSREMLLSRCTLDKAEKLEIITATYGGIKRNVDAQYALQKGVTLSCTGPARARSVAEFTLALTMDALLHVSRIHHAMRSGSTFPRFGYTTELTGKTVGVIGFGAISKDFISLLKPFSADVLVYSRHAADQEISAVGARKVDFNFLLQLSQVVVVLTGLTSDTRHLLDEKALALLPQGALVVNTSRGPIIDEKALITELKTGRLQAALDVYEEEPLPLESPLRNLDNVVLTAHSANSTKEMDKGRWDFALEELLAYFSGNPLQGELDAHHIRFMSDD